MVIAVDPGASYVGVAFGDLDDWCTVELPAPASVPFIDGVLEEEEVDVLVLEAFVLYPGKAGAQAWQPMETSEQIGAFKLLAKQHGVRVVERGANTKKPTRAQLRGRGIKQVGNGPHERDAELHLLGFLLQEQQREEYE